MSQKTYRKLVALLYADVQGYSKMMEENDTSTVKSLTRTRQLFEQNIVSHHGRIVNAPGDSILAEFTSVVEAVECAVVVQELIQESNNSLVLDEQMKYRIGINLGDVIEKNDELFGDGVNIAARVESLSPVGGVCITRPVYDQVKGVLSDFNFRYKGKHQVKNIKEPVWIYEVGKNSDQTIPTNPDETIEISEEQKKGTTIAVLPFENFSGQQENDYFTRGFVEDLITDLAHFKSLDLISSYTSAKISTNNQNELEISRKLGIDFLLRGALTRKKNRIRITTQLIETESGKLLWAEKYESPVDEIFDIQDNIVDQVAGSISIQIDQQLLSKSRRKPSTNLAVYDYWLQGMEELRNGSTETDQRARKIFEKALAIDPYYSRAYTGISLSYFNDWSCQVTDQWDTIGKNAYNYAHKAVTLDSSDHIAQLVIGRILMFRYEFDLAEQHIDKSIVLNPNDADNLTKQASCKAFLGKPEEGEKLFLKALKLNPYRSLWYYTHGALTYFVQQKFDACIETALKGPLTEEWIDLPAFIAASYAHKGNLKKAGYYLSIFIKIFQEKISKGERPEPDEIIKWCRLANPFRHDKHWEIYLKGILKAGLKGKPIDPIQPKTEINIFRFNGQIWQMCFVDKSVSIPTVKGFNDIAVLLACPGKEVHCAELIGSVGSFKPDEPVLDTKAKQTFKKKIDYLKSEIDISDNNNDVIRSQKLRIELDQLTDHIKKSVGLSGRPRNLNPDTERARSAVTWRIRSAIKKISNSHPELGRHLNHSVTTGTFCSYQPEHEFSWKL